MTNETFEKATELSKSIDIIQRACRMMSHPYPVIDLVDDVSQNSMRINFVSLDEKTQKELKEAVTTVLFKRQNELFKEFESL